MSAETAAAEAAAVAAAAAPAAAASAADDAAARKKEKEKAKKKEKAKAKKTAEKEKKPEKKGAAPKGGKAAMLAIIQAQQAAAAAEEERLRREEEERLRREAEEKRLREEEAERERLAEEERRRKKEEKKERLRAAGKLLTEAQRRQRAARRETLEQMLAAGQISEAQHKAMVLRMEAGGADEVADVPKKKVVYGDRKKRHGAQRADGEGADAAAADAAAAGAGSATAQSDRPDVVDSWDQLLDDDEFMKPSGGAAAVAAALGSAPTDSSASASASNANASANASGGAADAAVRSNAHAVQAAADDVAALSIGAASSAPAASGAPVNSAAVGLRSPICVVLGHVDTGKTKLLDKIRHTNVQGGEAGGITQQIGATYFPIDSLRAQIEKFKEMKEISLPGLLIIDTPGHESFTNLRSRGSSLCDIAVLVVDIMHGIEKQTEESIRLLRSRKTPFIVALNKIDRLNGWEPKNWMPFKKTFKLQPARAKEHFEELCSATKVAFAEHELNAELYTKNKDFRKFVSLVPTSAHTGEGVPDLLMLIVQLTQKMMNQKLMYLDRLQCTVLEVKMVEGLGTTIDVILVNGILHEGDRIVVCGLEGPIITDVRALLTPHPMKEIRVKTPYLHHKMIPASMGVKIAAHGLDKAVAGSQLAVIPPGASQDEEDEAVAIVMADLENFRKRLDKTGRGVYVQASTLGSLEALLEFLRSSKIPVSQFNVGPIHKRDVIQASVMLEHRKEYATILGFDVLPTPEARQEADKLGVQIFTADIIYHLFDQFMAYMERIEREKREATAARAIFPCSLKYMTDCTFNKREPIVIGVCVTEGSLRVNTPLAVPGRENLHLGKVVSIELNKKPVQIAKKGSEVAIKIQPRVSDMHLMAGRHFEEGDEIVSEVTRDSIDALKEAFRDEVSKDEWKLIVHLKKYFRIN